ncbi:MAG: sodium:alanine symporter family protein, partial [Clostridia bacterium]|nr:sodium:alanine symporter family protein [Clostridia bacterium]
MYWLETVNEKIGSFVWGTPMLVLFIGTGVYLTVKSGFFQIRCANIIGRKTVLSLFRKRPERHGEKSVSPFQALTTALASTLGNGNIVGVATAISCGGAGSVFWMWVSAFFGMMTHFSESVLGIYFRHKNERGEWMGGPMYYLEEGLKNKKIGRFLAMSFALFCMLASFGIGNMTQVNSISAAMKESFGLSRLFCGISLAVLAGFVILGGVQRIGRVTEKIVPLMSALYIGAALWIVICNISRIPYVFTSIFQSAFSLQAVEGAGTGLVMKRAVGMGVRRGVFSNEAGLGSSVMAHCAADVREPAEQGMWGVFEVFVDTIVVCTLTAFVILSTTVEAKPLEQGLTDLGTDVRYVTLSGEGGTVDLIHTAAHPEYAIGSEGGRAYPVTTVDGKEYVVYLREPKDADYVFTNVMKLRGIQSKDEQGRLLFTDEGRPIITAVSFESLDGISLATYAFARRFGPFAGKMLSVAVLFFAFATVLGWSLYGAQAAEYLLGPAAGQPFKLLFILAIIIGATQGMEQVWSISDTLNGLMAIPNLIGVLYLSPLAISILKNYEDRYIANKDVLPLRSAHEQIP